MQVSKIMLLLETKLLKKTYGVGSASAPTLTLETGAFSPKILMKV
jgi:hypothetical protein